MNSRDILRRLKAEGWYDVGQSGSHVQLKHGDRPGRTAVPDPRADLPLGTLKSIEAQSGVTAADTPTELAEMAREALTLHLIGMVADGCVIPEATPMERLPHDPDVAHVGVMLVTATLGGGGEVNLELSPETLQRADQAAAKSGRTRERVLTEGLERLFAGD